MAFLKMMSVTVTRCFKYTPCTKNHSIPIVSRIPTYNPKSMYCTTLRTDDDLTHDEQFVYEDPKSEDEVVNISFRDDEGVLVPIRAKIGDNVLRLAHRYDLDLEGACNGVCGCSTCHIYVEGEHEDLIEEPSEREDDMLDLVPQSLLKTNSRLGCQIFLEKKMEGMILGIPSYSRNFYVDGHKPQSH